MLEEATFQAIINRCLDRVSNDVDKREGSIIYDAIAAAAAELAILYTTLSVQMDRAFPDTAADVDLTNKAKERGILRLPATYAVRKGVFTDSSGAPMDIPIGSRWSGGAVNFTTTAKIATGAFQMTAETAGEAGNAYTGVLFFIDFVDGLGSATLTDVLIYGEEEETDDALRARYGLSLRETRYGGNIADYIDRVTRIPGVGTCKVYPAWNGGGTVRLVITSSAGGVPSTELIGEVQQIMDPPGYSGKGKGVAPIEHYVTVAGAAAKTVNVTFSLTFGAGYTWASLQSDVVAAIAAYIVECVSEWAGAEQIIVRTARVEAAILAVRGVLDIAGTNLNGSISNLTLDSEEIPQIGTVTNT